MTLPEGMAVVTLTFGQYPSVRSIGIRSPVQILHVPSGDVVFDGVQVVGKKSWQVDLPATDGPDINPRGFTYAVTVKSVTKYVYLPLDVPVVDYDLLVSEDTSDGTIWYPSEWQADQAARAEAAAAAAEVSAAAAALSEQSAAESAESVTGMIPAIESVRDQAVDAVESAGSEAVTDVGTARSGALDAVGSARTTALSDVDDARSGAVSAVGAAQSTAVDAVGVAGSSAVTEVTTARGAAVQAVADAGVVVVGAAEDARDGAVTARTGAETARDQTEAISGLTGEDEAVAYLLGDEASESSAALAASVTANTTSKVDRAPLDARGFDMHTVNRAHLFLAFDPSGAMIANLVRTPGGRTLGRSTDGGTTWTPLGTPSTTHPASGLWFTQAGTWIAYAASKLWRSTDGGTTWADVATTGTILNRGLAQEVGGTLWAAEYLGAARIFRSIDDGATWTVAYDFPNTDDGSGTVIRHAHGVAALPSGVWVCTGDNNTQCGLWRWEGGTFVRKSPALTDAQGAQRWRAVDVTERGGWLYWVQDGASPAGAQPAIVKAHPSNLAGTLTILAEVPTGGWYLSTTPSGEILVGSVNEGIGPERDRAARLWVVDTDDRVTEVWSAQPATGLATDFIAVRNLAVRPSDGLIGFTVNQTDFTGPGSSAYATIIGRAAPGARPLAVSRTTAPTAYTAVEAWTSPAPTEGPTVAGGGAYAPIPDLAVPVTVGTIRAHMVALTMDCRNSIAGQYTMVRVVAVDAVTGGVTQVGPTQRYGSQAYGSLVIAAVWLPAAAGQFTIRAEWLALGSSTGESGGSYRSLSVARL